MQIARQFERLLRVATPWKRPFCINILLSSPVHKSKCKLRDLQDSEKAIHIM